MKKQLSKRLLSLLLVLLMLVQIVPAATFHSHAADHTDKTIDFNYVSEYRTAENAIKGYAKEGWSYEKVSAEDALNPTGSDWVQIYDGDLKREGGKFREVMESSDPKEKFIVLAQVVELSYKSGEWKPIEIKSDKVLDLNGYTLTWWDATNKEKGEDWQSTNITDHYKDKVLFRIKQGATLTIIDSSAPVNGYDTGKGEGAIITGAQIIDCYEEQLDYYTHRDIFEVDGNLVIYGGTFTAGRQKDMYKSNFTWEKLADCLGKTLTLGVSIAEYATGLTGAEAALKDVDKAIQNSKPAAGNTSNENDAETSTPRQNGTGGTKNQTVNTPASAGANGNASQTRPQTVEERKNTANANATGKRAGNSSTGTANSTGQSTANTNGENTANSKGTAKVDENSKLAEAKKAVVTAALNTDKIMSMYNNTVAVIKSIGSMLGSQEGTRVTQTIFGTVARVKASGTLVVYGGTFQGHGSSANLRNATIEVVRQGLNGNFTEKGYATGGKAYIYGGTFEAFAGANVFNLIRLPKADQIGTARNFRYETKGHVIQRIHYYTDGPDWEGKQYSAYTTYTLDDSETNGYEVVDYENQDELKANPNLTAIPVDTSNIVVRNGTFRCNFEVNNTGARMPQLKEKDPTGEGLTFIKFTGTTGSVNLGLESFGEDMIRDGRIQLNDVYGDGTLVLMDEDKEDTDSVPLKHYRLYCGDNELRMIRYLEVYPMNAGANSTNSFALQTYYGEGNLTNITSWNEENEEENIREAPYSNDEYFFDYEYDAQDARDYYVMPRLNGGVYGADDLTSDVWYYNLPTDTKGKVIPDVTNYTMSYASYDYGGDTKQKVYTPVHSFKDLYIFEDGDYDKFGSATFYTETNDNYRQNLKWFRYRVYRVDPITRENISESKVWGVDKPLFEVVYGANMDDVLKCKLPLGLLEDAIKAKVPSWQGYQSGELYRVVLNVDEYLNYGYTGNAPQRSDKALKVWYFGDYVGLNDWGAGYYYTYKKDSFTGQMPVASTESSILIRCSSISEQAALPNVNPESNVAYDTNYTPLQFGSAAAMSGQNATIGFINAKVSQADNAGSDFIDVYYQWYVSDDPIIDRDPTDPTKVTDTLLAGITNICYDWNQKSDHLPHKWNPDGDIYEYRNTVDPDDPNYEAYGEDGLPDNTVAWNMYNLHAYTTELRPNQLCTRYPDKVSTPEDPNELSMQNNNPFAFNTDTCYIPEELAGKYLYVKVIVTNLKDEYTKIYDKKQVYYSHPVPILSPSILVPETQEPSTDVSSASQNWYDHPTTEIVVGQDLLCGFTGSTLPADLVKDGYVIKTSQRIYRYANDDIEFIYEADNGNTINLKDIVDKIGTYYVEQIQDLWYNRPYYGPENQYSQVQYAQEFVTRRVDVFPVKVDIAPPDKVTLDYPVTGFEVGEEITITATAEPEGDYWYRWLLNDDTAEAMDEMTVLQDSQSPVLKYTFTDETPQRFWVGVYSKDAYGNASQNVRYRITGNVFPGYQMAVTTFINGEEIVSENNYSATVHLEKGSDAVMTVEVAGGKGEYTYRAYKRPSGQAYDSLVGTSDTITIDTSTTGMTEYEIEVYDEYNQKQSLRLTVNIHEPLCITAAREATTTINKKTTLNMWVDYVGYQVTGQLYEKINGSWTMLNDVEWVDGDNNVTVSTIGTHEYRLDVTDYFGNSETKYFTVIYNNSVPQPVAANGEGSLIFRAKGDTEYGVIFSEGEDIEMFYTGGINYDPSSDLYTKIRSEIKEKLGLEIEPVADAIKISFELYRHDGPVSNSGMVNVYEEAGLELWMNSIYEISFDTESKMPESPLSFIDGTYMTPGYYTAQWYVHISCEDDYYGYGNNGKGKTYNTFYMTGTFEVVASGEEHVHDYSYKSGYLDEEYHYLLCICGHQIAEKHDFRTDIEDFNSLSAPWDNWDGYVVDSETGNGYWRESGVEYRMCYDPSGICRCWHTQYRWANVEALTLDNTSVALDVAGSTKLDYTIDFMEEFDPLWLEQNSSSSVISKVDTFLPPNNAVTWASSDESVATVDADGNITAVGSGTAIISCTTVQSKYEGGTITETCTVTVTCDHEQSASVAAIESTCSVAGCVEHYECVYCGAVSLDGTFTDGTTAEDVALPLAAHAASNVFGYNEEGHFRTCKYGCGYQFGTVTAHTYNVAAADCTTSKYCTRCKYVAEEQLAHNIIYVDEMPATCTDAGLRACYNCMNCGKYYTDAEGLVETTESKLNIRPLGHSWTEATCTDPKTCSACGETEGEALGHSWREADCENPETCVRCGETVGEALGHTWVAATCTDPKTCSVCRETEGEALPHSHNPADATCTTDAICPVCNTVVIPASGHSVASYAPNGDQHSGTCTTCGETVTAAHTFGENGLCTVCGASSAPILDESIKIYHTLNLASDISITFAVPKTALASYDSYYLECVIPKYEGNTLVGSSTVQLLPVPTGGYYYFTLTGVTAVQMNDMVDAVLHMTKGEQKYISKTDSYSVATYAYTTLNGNASAKMMTLCADLLRYGAEAQSYKKYRTDALVDANMTATHRSYLSSTASLTFSETDSYLSDLENPTITWLGKTLDLGSKVGIKFVFNTTNYSGDISNLSMKVTYVNSEGKTTTVTLTGAEAYGSTGSYYSFTFYGLLASELRTAINVAVYEGETRLSETMRYSAETYASKTIGKALEPLCRALFAYSDSAKAFFAK